MEQKERKVLLSLKNVEVKFNVRGRILTAIRNVSLDIYENESIAIVGESGSGKSVLTKTFAGMLETNGFISNGSIILADDEIAETHVSLNGHNKALKRYCVRMLNKLSVLERGAAEYNRYQEKLREIRAKQALSQDEEADYSTRIKTLSDDIVDKNNFRQRNTIIKDRKASYSADAEQRAADQAELAALKKKRAEKIAAADVEGNPNGLSDEVLKRNDKIANEIVLSIARYSMRMQVQFLIKLRKAFRVAMKTGENLEDDTVLNKIFEVAVFRVEFRAYHEDKNELEGYAIVDCSKVKYTKDWQQIRGRRIATVFQDPMTSLNPVIPIGKQIMMVILKHQKCSNEEAKRRTLDIMAKVGIPEPEKRFNDYPFEYSGGMRQRIVIAIALHDLGFTTVYITHDLGVVANVAERVAVLYAGQIVELGMVEEIFYDPRHPYTWALLSSLPQLCERGTDLFSIPGTPPSLYNKIVGDAFAPRNRYAMQIDLEEEPPMFQISETHFAKTWLLDPRAPKVEIPTNIQNLHEKMLRTNVKFEV